MRESMQLFYTSNEIMERTWIKQSAELRFSPILKKLEFLYCDEKLTTEMKILTVWNIQLWPSFATFL